MWIIAGAVGVSDPGSRSINLRSWTVAGLGITICLYKWVKYLNGRLGALALEECEYGIDRLPDDITCEKVGVLVRKESDNWIDTLPDDILGDIVSRLTSIEAFKTSILSKRWRKICTMNDSVMFNCIGTLCVSKRYHAIVRYEDRLRFLEAVSECLHLYSGRKLRSVLVHCCFLNLYIDYLEQWMQNLAGLDVEELYLGHSCRKCNGEPAYGVVYVFCFNTINGFNRLKYLDLTACYVETNFVRPCNSLVRLNLRSLELFSNELSDILMSCPNLKNVCLERCELPPNLRICGPNVKLETFEIDACYHVQKLEISNTNIVKITIDIDSEVEISLSSVPTLESLYLRTPEMHYSCVYAARDMPLLKNLSIQTTYQILRFPSKVQVFGNVRILSLLTKGFPDGETSEKLDLWDFAPVLVAAPLLEEFYLTVGGPVCERTRQSKEWPVLQHKHLTHMELSGFTFRGNVLEFARFIYSSAQVLETLKIRSSCRRLNKGGFFFEDVEDALGQKEAEAYRKAVRAYLKGQNISTNAKLELELY